MDIYSWVPWIILSVIGSIILFTLWNYLRTKKLPPTDEAVVGEYRIEVDVGTHIVPFEGTLYYFNKLLKPSHLHSFAKTIEEKDEKADLDDLRDALRQKGHFYAMRQGRKKVAFISLHHPIEISPFFKTSGDRKTVHAVGTVGEPEGEFQFVTMQPVDLSKNELNPEQHETFGNIGAFLKTLLKKAPLMQELRAAQAKNKVMERRVDDLADEVGFLKDEVEYWKHLAKAEGEKPEAKAPTKVPGWIKKYLPYAVVGVVAYLVSPAILPETHPIALTIGSIIATFIIRKLIGK